MVEGIPQSSHNGQKAYLLFIHTSSAYLFSVFRVILEGYLELGLVLGLITIFLGAVVQEPL